MKINVKLNTFINHDILYTKKKLMINHDQYWVNTHYLLDSDYFTSYTKLKYPTCSSSISLYQDGKKKCNIIPNKYQYDWQTFLSNKLYIQYKSTLVYQPGRVIQFKTFWYE